MKIELDITPASFQSMLAGRLRLPRAQLPWLVEDIVVDLLRNRLQPLLDAGSLLAVKLRPYRHYKPTTLAEIVARDGVILWYLKIEIDAPLGTVLSEEDIATPMHLVWQPIRYGGLTQRNLKFKRRTMKTRERYFIEILNPTLPVALFRPTLEGMSCGETCDPELLDPVITGVWDWRIRFVCRICARSSFCSCFRRAIELDAERKSSRSSVHRGADVNGHRTTFREGICHICTGKPSDLIFCHTMYGSPILVHYGPWIRKLQLEHAISQRDAENQIRETLGVPKIGEGWLSETQLFRLVTLLVPGHAVIREASPSWLGRQRLDIYVPTLGFAMEYQGQQHYKPVERFGGVSGLSRTKERDRTKRDLCAANGVGLVYVRFNEDLTEERVRRKLKKYLQETPLPSGQGS